MNNKAYIQILLAQYLFSHVKCVKNDIQRFQRVVNSPCQHSADGQAQCSVTSSGKEDKYLIFCRFLNGSEV